MLTLSVSILLAAAIGEGCASETPKAGLGDKCEESAQCDQSKNLVCRCVRRKSADDEGPEQILAPGVCQAADYKCPTVDAGPPFEGGVDSGADVGADVGADAGETGEVGADGATPETGAVDTGGDGAAEAADTGDG